MTEHTVAPRFFFPMTHTYGSIFDLPPLTEEPKLFGPIMLDGLRLQIEGPPGVLLLVSFRVAGSGPNLLFQPWRVLCGQQISEHYVPAWAFRERPLFLERGLRLEVGPLPLPPLRLILDVLGRPKETPNGPHKLALVPKEDA